MDSHGRLEISELCDKSADLIERCRLFFDEIGCDNVALPSGVFDGETPVSFVFAGQYSAGKSTIVKALTGIDDIKIGHEITTDVAREYDWHGIRVIDTPGIGTGRLSEHDEISFKAIANADILVYVVTYSLFDDLIAQDFRRLLIDQNKADEMILVVNKMEDANSGNTQEQRDILEKDLERVTTPYSPSYLHVVFIDADSYIRSMKQAAKNSERAEYLRIGSNFEALETAMNDFVKTRGLLARLTTPLYQLLDALESAAREQTAANGDEDIDVLEEQLLRKRSIITSSMHSIEASVKQIYSASAMQICEEGRKLADAIQNCKNNEDAEDMAIKAQASVNDISDDCNARIVASIKSLNDQYSSTLEEFCNSDISRNLQQRLDVVQEDENSPLKMILQPDLLKEGGNMVTSTTVGSNATAAGLKAFTGSGAHSAVLNIGHFFGHSFKPWEAVKYTKGINVAGKALGVIGVALSLGLQVKSDHDADVQQQKMRQNRESIRALYNEAAESLRSDCENNLQKFLDEPGGFREQIDEINGQLDKIRELRSADSEVCKKLNQISGECKELIAEIHKHFPVGEKPVSA